MALQPFVSQYFSIPNVERTATKQPPQLFPRAPAVAMARQGGDPKVIRSSIAILQERFMELQRARERREQIELMKYLTEPGPGRQCQFTGSQAGTTAHLEQPKLSFQHQTANHHQYPPSQQQLPSEDCLLSLGGSSPRNNQGEFRVVGVSATLPANLWPNYSTNMSRAPENSDVDTSLRL